MPDSSLGGASAHQADGTPNKQSPLRTSELASTTSPDAAGTDSQQRADASPSTNEQDPSASSALKKGKAKDVGASSASASASRPGSSSGNNEAAAAETSPAPPKKRPSTRELHLDQYIVRDHLHSAALWQQMENSAALVRNKRREIEYYHMLRQNVRSRNPGAVFGYGYQGYGNGFTDVSSRVVYPCQRKRTGGRESRELRLSRAELQQAAEQKEVLVPVRLDLEHNNIKLRDTFTWNLHDRTVPVEVFSEQLLEDFHLPVRNTQLLQTVANSIREQVTDFYPHVFLHDEPLDPNLPYTAYKNDDMRIVIKLNITIGQHTLVDQFEWDINNPQNSPEEFAQLLTRELSLSGEFTTSIAHCIREQSQLFTRALFVTSHPFDGRPIEDEDVRSAMLASPFPSVFRPHAQQKEFTPTLYELSENDIARAEQSQSRERRRINRRVNRRGGPTIPDLKDMPKTHRTQIVSSTLPGAVQKLSELEKTMLAKPLKDGADSDDDESDSDPDDLPPEQRIPGFANMTKRQKLAALNALRAQPPRSQTPETHRRRDPETPRPPPAPRDPPPPAAAPPTPAPAPPASPTTPPPPRLPRRPNAPPTADSAVITLRLPPAALRALAAKQPPPTTTPHHPPPPPAWLTAALAALHATPAYALDRFEGTMRYTAYDATTRQVVPQAQMLQEKEEGREREVVWEWTARIRCHDCPGKLYTPGPGETVENFLMHLKNRGHRERVEARIKAANA